MGVDSGLQQAMHKNKANQLLSWPFLLGANTITSDSSYYPGHQEALRGTRNGRKGKPEESQGHLLVFVRCYRGLAAFFSQNHIASLAGMGSKKDKGIFELLNHLGAFCTEGPKAGFTMDEVFI